MSFKWTGATCHLSSFVKEEGMQKMLSHLLLSVGIHWWKLRTLLHAIELDGPHLTMTPFNTGTYIGTWVALVMHMT